MKRPRSEIASAINPDSVLVVDDTMAKEKADPRSEDESSLLALIDGKRTVAEVLRLSRMSGFVAMRRLRSLLERQIIRPGLRVQPLSTTTPVAGSPKAGRMGLTQDLTSAATTFAEHARALQAAKAESSRGTTPMGAVPADRAAPAKAAPAASPAAPPRSSGPVTTPIGARPTDLRPPERAAPTAVVVPTPVVPDPSEPRPTPLQGSPALPSVIITFGPDFLEPRKMPTRRLPGAEGLPRKSGATTQRTVPLPGGNAPLVKPPLKTEPPEAAALVRSSPPTGENKVVSLQKTSLVPRTTGRRMRRRTPATSREIEAQELWLTVTRREWQTLAVIPAHPDGSALSIASALAEAGSLLRGKPVELFSADRADHSPSGPMPVMNGRATSNIPLHAVPPGGLPPASERFERVVALEPLTLNPMGATIAHAAEAVLMIAERGITELRTAKRTVEMIGRERFIGCVLVSSSRR
jgi:hypothetical protein